MLLIYIIKLQVSTLVLGIFIWLTNCFFYNRCNSNTYLKEIPNKSWDYMLWNRSSLKWILDQYKEKKPKDLTIAEKFNTYQFTYYKDQVIGLLMRVCAVSLKTLEIIEQMKEIE
jgi:predicted helicase